MFYIDSRGKLEDLKEKLEHERNQGFDCCIETILDIQKSHRLLAWWQRHLEIDVEQMRKAIFSLTDSSSHIVSQRLIKA